MDNWTTYKLKNVCSKIGSGATPRGGKESYLAEGEISLIRSQNVLDFKFSTDGLAFIKEEQANQLSNVVVEERDVLLNITGDSVARVCQAPSSILPARVNQHVAIIRPNKQKLLPELLKYYLLNPPFKAFMLGRASSGGTRNALTKAMIEEFEITVPESITEQQAIAKILSLLDEKIELHEQIISALEVIARALFKAWFLDFEPVLANMEGRRAESASPDIAKLFPSDFENGIPKGWINGTVGDLAGISKNTISPNRFPNEEFDHFSIPAFDEGKRAKHEEGTLIQSNKFLIDRDSILVSKLNPRIYRVWTVYARKDYRQIASTEFIIYQPRNKNYWSFLNGLMRSDAVISRFQQQVTGTSSSHQRVKPESTLNLDVVTPSEETAKAFDNMISPVYLQIEQILEQSQKLSQIRDALLPRLISGRIPVTELNNEMEDGAE